jgi:N6-adenosine-specific RNA methylase IME4
MNDDETYSQVAEGGHLSVDRGAGGDVILAKAKAQYVESITSQWLAACAGMLDAIFRIGAELIEAKAELEHGQFLALIEAELPFGRLTAWRFMTIARDGRLRDVSTSKHLPPHWNTLHKIPRLDDQQFERLLDNGTIRPEITYAEVNKVLRVEKVAADEARVLRLAPIVGKFRTLVVDPGWEWDRLSRAVRARAGYAMQTHAELLNLNVRRWADETVGCHLYLWVPNNFMARAWELMARWGFQHRTVITWVKEGAFGQGSYFRNSTEHVLFGRLGKTTTRPAAASLATHFVAPRGEEHSEKPEAFYDLVRAASYPPHGEANQRTPRPDFVNLFRELEAADSDAEGARHG